MKLSAKPTRSRVRASALREAATVARERLEAFELHDGIDAGPDLSATDAARWEQACRAAEQTERAATAAEAREAARPLDGKRAALARKRAATAEAQSGSRVVKVARAAGGKVADSADLARVAGCRGCGTTVELRGDPWRLWALGWGSVRDVAAPCGTWLRVWWCPECWVPPALTSADADAGYTPGVLGMALSPRAVFASRQRADSRPRRHLESDLRRLAEVDPLAAERVVQRLVFTAPTVYLENAWKVFAEDVLTPKGAVA